MFKILLPNIKPLSTFCNRHFCLSLHICLYIGVLASCPDIVTCFFLNQTFRNYILVYCRLLSARRLVPDTFFIVLVEDVCLCSVSEDVGVAGVSLVSL